MFFLKDMPTRQMVDGYTAQYAGGKTSDILGALTLMRRASLLVRELEKYFASHDLSQLRFLVLIVIDRELERDWLSMSELATRLDVSKPVITRTVSTLAEAGLVNILEDETDRRARQLRLSTQGKAKLEHLMPGYFKLLISPANP